MSILGDKMIGKEVITDTNKITTFRKLKIAMLDLLRGYPEYEYFGKFESFFTKNGEKVVEILGKDNLIELAPRKKGEQVRYRLTPTGINLAISMINLDYSEKTNYFTKILIRFTIILILMTFGMFIFAFIQLLIAILF